MLNLSTAVRFIRGVGEARAKILENRGILTAEDLLYYLPYRYEDRTRLRGPEDVRAGEQATVIAPVLRAGMLSMRRGGMKIFRAELGDTKHWLNCKWFHGGYLERIIKPGQILAVHGNVELDLYEGGFQMVQPQYEILPEAPTGEHDAAQSLEVGRIVPVYEHVGGGKLTSRFFRKVIHTILESLGGMDDPLPCAVRQQLALISRWEAIRHAHFPLPGTRLTDLDQFRSPAQVRLIFEEFFFLETGLALKKKKAREIEGIAYRADAQIRECLKKILPFHPTKAQKNALAEIVQDMRSPHPMHRLLQGDVGSGKTIVALQAAVIAIENGYQVAVMAPTEILAQQQFFYFRRLLARSGYHIALLSGSATAGEKKAVKKLIKEGLAQVAIGTHALVEGNVEFKALGLVIIDEQHRFGVMQRLRLMQKGKYPDTLVMTATPIPRTLALTMYGDLDVSLMDELPPNRLPIVTRQAPEEAISQANEFIRAEVKSGAQAYVVCPVIEDGSEAKSSTILGKAFAAELKSAVKTYESLANEVFPEFRVGLLHGKLPAEEKERTMQQFQTGEIQILVGTTVVEVGVDVPNATVMMILQAERFGLSQLHQLRGRVGRGKRQSHCLLITSRQQTEVGRQRLATLERTNNGFEIAEMDLKLRGPGEFMGVRQSGLPTFRVANLLRDQEMLEWARRLAQEFVDTGERGEVAKLVQYLKENWNRRYGLVAVG
ncbi:MAG: ATP-dependent DNA helicase RecG [Acidobacteria bacterium RIFCSPLOWO2_12_FULL_54_10]|nr:MAG: ATP-dependent DNA helicase RecG [Acidobacteria bacterium RIFCSPLOWO2_12_FULL_54_10]